MSSPGTNQSLSSSIHKGDRSIGKAIKGSMVPNDSFVYFEITGVKQYHKTSLETIKEKEL